MPSCHQATYSFPWHQTKPTLGVSVCVMRCCSSLSPSYFPSHFAVFHLHYPPAPGPQLSPPLQVACLLHQQAVLSPVPFTGNKSAWAGTTPPACPLHRSCWPDTDCVLTLAQALLQVSPQGELSLFICTTTLASCSPKNFSSGKHTQLTQLAMLSWNLLQFISSTVFSIVSQYNTGCSFSR